MKQIEFERWEPDAENPCKLKYAGQRKAEDVFHELEAQLDSVGYLPDEYFTMDWRWEHGRQIPKGADFFLQNRLRRQRGNLSGRLSGMAGGRQTQKGVLHHRQNAGRKRRGSGQNVPYLCCDHESVPRGQRRPRAVHGSWRAVRAGRNDVPEPVSGRTATGHTGVGGAAYPAGIAGRGRRKSSCAV